MAYKEFTKCIKPSLFIDLGSNFNGWRRIGFTGLAEFIILVPLAFLGALPVLIALVYQIIIFVTWWLDGRLICLGSVEDKCLIGAIEHKFKPNPRKKGGDDDATMNVYLADSPITEKVNDVFRPIEEFWTGPQGNLLRHQAAVTSIGRGYATDDDHYIRFAAIHCEFEGEGMKNLLSWAQAILILLLAALVVPPPFNYIILAIAFLISLFAGLNNWLDLGPLDFGEPGNHLDVNPNLGILEKGDIVFVKGRWIYDSLHDGWNEIHAVHACQKIGKLSVAMDSSAEELTKQQIWGTIIGSPPIDGAHLDVVLRQWCQAAKDANAAEEGGNRNDPKNDWQIHPSVDGCQEPVVIL